MKSEAEEERMAVHPTTIHKQRDRLFYSPAGEDRDISASSLPVMADRLEMILTGSCNQTF